MISGVSKEHYSLQAFTKNTVLCEGQQGTVSENGHMRAKEKVMRSLDHEDSAQVMLDGMRVYYNFIRPHMALNGQTPAEKAGISKKDRNKWKELIRQSTKLNEKY